MQESSKTVPFSLIKRRLLVGGGWALLGKASSVAAVVILNIFLARLIDSEELGIYFLVFSVVSIVSLLGQGGLNQIAVRLIAEAIGSGDKAKATKIVYKMLLLNSFIVSFLVVVINAGLVDWVFSNLFHTMMPADLKLSISVWVFSFFGLSFVAECFRGFHDIRMASIFSGMLTNSLMALAFSVAWVSKIPISLSGALNVAATIHFVILMVALIPLWVKVSKYSMGGTIYARDIISMALPLQVTAVTFFLLTQADLWVLGMFRPMQEVGIYGVALRIFALASIPLVVINSVLAPIVAELHAKREIDKLEIMLRGTAFLASVPTLLVLLVFVVLGENIISIVFGASYGEGGVILAILSVGYMFQVLTGSCGLVLAMTGNQTSLMRITFVSGAVVILSALLLVGEMGGVGVAAASALGITIQNIMMIYAVKRKLGIWTHVGSARYVRAILN